MIETLFIEKELLQHSRAMRLIEKIPHKKRQEIDRYDDVFGKVKKPYLQKRETLNAFVAKKRGQLIKQAPDAYGLAGDPHYYFIHAYNCLYECEYCYLQGYFHSPDLVFFVNHDEIVEEMKNLLKDSSPEHTVWFHAGEFSDSLALSHLTGELPVYFDFFRQHPQAKLELRTKSTQIAPLLDLEPLDNVITTFSLSPKERARRSDLRTPPTDSRLKAIGKLANAGHPLGIHFDPIIYEENFKENYAELIQDLAKQVDLNRVEYFSLGVIRFPKSIYQQVEQNYPTSDLLGAEFTKSFDQKTRYPRPMRLWMLSSIKQMLLDAGAKESTLYLCMEDEDRMVASDSDDQ